MEGPGRLHAGEDGFFLGGRFGHTTPFDITDGDGRSKGGSKQLKMGWKSDEVMSVEVVPVQAIGGVPEPCPWRAASHKVSGIEQGSNRVWMMVMVKWRR
jgi:hypothetical protein